MSEGVMVIKLLAGKPTVVLILLAIATFLICCANDSGSDTIDDFEPPDFMYVTEVIPFPKLPEWFSDIGVIALADDVVYFTVCNNGNENVDFIIHNLFVMKTDGTGFAELPNHSAESFPIDATQGYAFINHISIDNDGNLWTVETGNFSESSILDDLNLFYKIRKLDDTGTELMEIDISSLVGGNDHFYISAFCIDSVENIYIAVGEDIYVFTTQGNQRFNLTARDHVMQLIRLGDGSVAHFSCQQNGTVLQKIDVASRGWGEIIELSADVLSVFPGNEEFLAFFNLGVYLYGIDIETHEAVQILNWIDSDVVAEGVVNLTFCIGERIMASIQKQRGGIDTQVTELVRLTKTPYSELPEKTMLTLGTIYAGDILFDAVTQFNRISDTHRIHVIDYSSFNMSEESTAGLTRLTTEIIAGKGPDILDITDMPFRSYVTRGIFVELYPLLDADLVLSRDVILDNFLGKDEIDGGLYRVTPGFSLRTLIGSSSVLGNNPGWNVEEFLTVVDANLQASIYSGPYFSKLGFLQFQVTLNISEYVDHESGTVNFDRGEFIDLLELANTFPAEVSHISLPSILSGEQIMTGLTFSDFDSYMFYRTFFNGKTVIKGFPVENKNGHAIIPHCSIAISKKCQDMEGSWSFVRTLLLDSFQRDLSTQYFPVSKSVFEEKVTEAMDPRSGAQLEYVHGYGNVNMSIYPLSQDEADMIMAILDRAPIITEDEALWNIIQECASDFFNGLMTAQDAARVIQSRAATYISEQN